MGGSSPSAAWAAASAADAPPARASSTAVARTGVDAMLTSATPAPPPLDPDPDPLTAATPTMAQSWARRLNFWNDHPAPARRGTRISVSTSSGARAVSMNPVKNSAAGMVRSPPGPRATRVAPNASTTAGRSDAGSPWANEPPMVPRWRIWGSPTWPAAAGSNGTSSGQQLRRRHVVVAGQGADGDVVAVGADVRQVGQPADVDQDGRPGQPQLHEGQQRVAAGQQFGVVAVLGQQRDGLVGRGRPPVVEAGRVHRGPPFAPLALVPFVPFARWIV